MRHLLSRIVIIVVILTSSLKNRVFYKRLNDNIL